MTPDTLPGFEPVGIKPLDWLRRAMADDELTIADRASLAALLIYAPARPRPRRDWPSGAESGWDFHLSQGALGATLAASAKTAQRCLDHLQELGYLTMVERGRGVGRYGARASVWRLSVPVSTGRQSPLESTSQQDARVHMRRPREVR